MRRRPAPSPLDDVPIELRQFRAADWLEFVEGEMPANYLGGLKVWRAYEACRIWTRARIRWAEQNGWPTSPLELIQQNAAVRRQTAGAPRVRSGRTPTDEDTERTR